MNEIKRYDRIWRGLHWGMALAIVVLLVLIEVKGDLPKGPLKGLLTDIHKQLGILVFGLVWWRLVWRLRHRAPPVTPTPSRWMVGLSHGAHGLLYLAMIGIPALGVLFQQARGNAVVFPGWTLPWILNDDTGISYAKPLKELHETLGNALIWLIVLHGVAAFYHHWIRRDDTLLRMVGKPSVAPADFVVEQR